MQKKLLLSLVCIVPSALPALADVALTVPNVNDWNTTGIQGSDVQVDGTKVTCAVGMGTVYQKITGLPAGKYKISFSKLENAAWSVEGAAVVSKNDKLTGTFELTEVGDITINITAVNHASAYGFTDGMLTFVYDFSKKATEFQTALGKAEAIVGIEDNAATALKKEEAAVRAQLSAIEGLITTLSQADKNPSEAISVADLIKIYSGAKVDSFEALFAKIDADIEAYTETVAAWNVKARADNERYGIATENADNLKSLQGSIEMLLNNAENPKGVNPLISAINAAGVDPAVKAANIDGAKEVKANIESFKAEVEAAFKGATTLVDTKGFNATRDKLTKDLAAQWAKFENDMAAIGMFEAIQNVYEELNPNKEYLTATAEITNITDAKEYTGTDVYAGMKTRWLNELQEVNSSIKEPASFEEVDASLNVDGYRTKITGAIGDMNNIVTEAKALAEDQNGLYVEGYKLYATKTTGWDAQIADFKTRVCDDLPAELTDKYNALIAKAEKAVADFKALLDRNYANQTEGGLNGAGYDEAVAAANNAINEVNEFLNGDGNTGYGAVSGLIADLNALKVTNANKFKTLNGTKYPEFAVPTTKFDDSYAAIQAAIDVIVDGMNKDENHKADATQVRNAQTALENLEAASAEFFTVFTTAHTNLIGAVENLEKFKNVINKKYSAESGTYNSADVKEYKDLETELYGTKDTPGFKQLYLNAAAAEGEASLTQGRELSTQFGEFDDEIISAHKAWQVKATQANLDFAKKRSADLEAFMTAHSKLTTSVKFTEINTALGKITVPAETAADAAFTKADEAVKKQMTVMDGLYRSVANYQLVEAELNKFAAAKAKAETANNDITVGETAKAYYQGEINKAADTSKIYKELETAFNGETGVTDAKKDEQLAVAKAQLGTLTGFPAVIQANQDAYSNQIAESGKVRTAIQAIVEELEQAEYQGAVEDWLKELNNLLDVDLIANDVKVGGYYGKGQSAAKDAELKAEYARILTAAQKVQTDYNTGYDAKIISANNAITGDGSDWAVNDKLLNDEYLKAVGLYTFYKYNLTDASGYKEFMAGYDLVANYAAVYDFLPEIQKLNSDIQALITKANEAKQYLPESEKYKAEYEALNAAQAKELADLQATYNSLVTDGDNAATDYYNAKTAEYAKLVSDVTGQLTAAGFSDAEVKAALKSVTDLLASADELFKGTKITKGETVNTIAEDYFSKIGTQEAIVDAAAKGKWNASYSLAVNGKPAAGNEPAVPSVNELRTSIADNGGTKAQLDAFDAIVKKMADLNTKATTKHKPLINYLQADLTELNAYRTDLEEMAQAVSDNAMYQELWNKYMGEYAEMEELVNILNEYIAEFNLTAPVRVTPEPETLLENLRNMIGKNPNPGVAGENFAEEVETQKNAIEDAVTAKMAKANDDAVTTLKTWIANTKGAYNTAIANGKPQAELQAEYDTIQKIDAIYKEWTLNDYDLGFTANFPAEINGHLNTILETYRTLIPDTAAAELNEVRGELEAQKAEIAEEINDAREALEQLVRDYFDLDEEEELSEKQAAYLAALHSEMDPKYDELLAALDAIKADWEAEGDLLLVNNYEYPIRLEDEVQDKIAGLNEKAPEVLADIIKVQINQEVCEDLNKELDELSKLFAEVRTNVENWGLRLAFLREIGQIEADFAEIRKLIADEAGKTALTEESTLQSVWDIAHNPNGTTSEEWSYLNLRVRIESVGAMSAVMQTEYLMEESQKAYQEAYKTLAGKYFVNAAALKSAYWSLVYSWNDAVYGYYDPADEENYIPGCNNGYLYLGNAYYSNIKLYLGWIDAFNSIIEGSKTLIEDAQGQEYTPGDVANRDGEVTSQDVTTIVNWVGNGVTYAQLAGSEETLWQAVAADINGDSNINIADITADIDLALGKQYVTGGVYDGNLFRKPAAAVQSNVNCTLAYLGNVDGNDRYAVVLNNETELLGGQFDIKLPIGMSLVNVVAAERTEAHEVVTFEHNAYESRVIIFSMNNEAIKGNNGALVYIDVQGHGSFSLDEILFSDSEYNVYGVGNPGTSGIIDAVIDGAGAVKEAIYDAAGRMYDRVQRGVNIIRHSDGTVTKELRK